MASGAKRKTTMAKLSRESKLRERRLIKQAKKEARKQTRSDHTALNGAATADEGQLRAEHAALKPDAQPLAQAE
jgi:hypothetical protein